MADSLPRASHLYAAAVSAQPTMQAYEQQQRRQRNWMWSNVQVIGNRESRYGFMFQLIKHHKNGCRLAFKGMALRRMDMDPISV